MDREDWKELVPEIMRVGAETLITKLEVEIGVLQTKCDALKKYLEERNSESRKS